MDTMVIMGLDDLYDKALDFVLKTDFTKTKSGPAKGFETGIRYLGGLLSANDLRPNPGLVKKAVELTENVLLPLFSSPSGAPYTFMDVGRLVIIVYPSCCHIPNSIKLFKSTVARKRPRQSI